MYFLVCVTSCFTLTSRFLPPRPTKVMIYATQCHHCISFFLFGQRENLGICEATKDSHSASSKKNEKRGSICGLHLEEPLNWDSLRAALGRNWPSNALPKDADPELRHSMYGSGWRETKKCWSCLSYVMNHLMIVSLKDHFPHQ